MRFIFFSLLFLVAISINAQEIPPEHTEVPENSELLEIQSLAKAMISEKSSEQRKANCYKFIPALVNYLKQKNSFELDLSNIPQISVLNAPDNSFRIITWGIEENLNITGQVKSYSSNDQVNIEPLKYTYYGAIQMNSAELKLFPLEDKSADIETPEDLVLDSSNWYGAIYYGISTFNLNGTPCYALYGWDGNTGISTKKIMDILSFKQDKAIFGMPIIEVVRDKRIALKHRFIHEFRAGASVSLNWDEKLQMVIYDFIEPPDTESKGIYPLYIPDGTYNGLRYENNVWRYVERVYDGNEYQINPDQLINDRQQKLNDAQENKKKKKKRKKRS